MLSKLIQDLNSEYIAEARNSPNLLEDMAAMEKYMAESYSGRIFVELLQNADDCESSKILLEEYEGNIIFANNGRPFDANDIISISRSGASRKERGSKIGYRGVGFKSTAYLTSEIIIYSSNTYFTFSKSKCAKVLNKPSDKLPTIRIPFLVDDIELHLKNHINDLVAQGYTTIFIFLNAKLEQFKEEIKSLDNGYFLFLYNVQNCIIKMNEINFYFKRVSKSFNSYNTVLFEGHKKEEWLIIRKNEVAIAMKFIDNRVVPCNSEEAVYHCFLPTLDKTPFALKLNADFTTDPSRKHITQDVLTDKAFDKLALLIFETIQAALRDRNTIFVEFLNMISMPNSFSIMNQKLINKLNTIIQKSLRVELRNNSTQLISKCKLIPNIFENSEKSILRKSQYIGMQSIKDNYYFSFPLIDNFIERYSKEFFSAEEISRTLAEKSFVEQLNPQTYAKILSCVTNAIKAASIANKDSLSIQDILIPCESGVVGLEQIGTKKPSDALKRAISEIMSPYDIKLLSSKIGIDSERICIQTSKQIETYYINTEMKNASIPTNKPVISKWRSAEQQCIELEKYFGNDAIDVSRQNIGYDVKSTTPDGENRFIEVKLLNSSTASFTITNNEYTAAHQYGENYIICLLIQSENNSKVIYIKDPLKSLHFEKRVRQWEWYCEQYSGEEYEIIIK